MKNSIFHAAVLFAGILSVVSCNKTLPCTPDAPADAEGGAVGTVVVNVMSADALTKASNTTATDAETAITDVQILLFDSNGNVASYLDAGTSSTASVKIKAGTYTAWAVVNGPDLVGIKTTSEIAASRLALDSWNSPSSDFVMGGCVQDVSVNMNTETSVEIAVSRYVSRIRLAEVSNGCPAALGNITLKRAFLSNVVCNQNIGASAAPSEWSNVYGRADVSKTESIIDGSASKAVPEALTYYGWTTGGDIAHGASAEPGRNFYSYPNSNSDAVKSWKASRTDTATRLVLVAEVNGNEFYYPVAIPASQRNCSYDVSIAITGEGLDDPQGDPAVLKEKGTVKVTVTLSGWSSGSEYNLEY